MHSVCELPPLIEVVASWSR